MPISSRSTSERWMLGSWTSRSSSRSSRTRARLHACRSSRGPPHYLPLRQHQCPLKQRRSSCQTLARQEVQQHQQQQRRQQSRDSSSGVSRWRGHRRREQPGIRGCADCSLQHPLLLLLLPPRTLRSPCVLCRTGGRCQLVEQLRCCLRHSMTAVGAQQLRQSSGRQSCRRLLRGKRPLSPLPPTLSGWRVAHRRRRRKRTQLRCSSSRSRRSALLCF